MNPAAGARGSPAPSSSKPSVATTAKRPRRAAAAPLSDVTNLLPPLPAVDTPPPTKPRRTTRRTTLQQQAAPSSDASSTCSSPACVTPAAPKHSFTASLEEEGSAVKSPTISTVYARRGAATEARGRGRRGAPTTDKGKGKVPDTAAAEGTTIRPQLGKSTGNRSRKPSVAQDTRPISASAPCHREAKKRRLSSSTPKLPDDFVREKKAYFAEIDAFELPEEEVSETDLD